MQAQPLVLGGSVAHCKPLDFWDLAYPICKMRRNLSWKILVTFLLLFQRGDARQLSWMVSQDLRVAGLKIAGGHSTCTRSDKIRCGPTRGTWRRQDTKLSCTSYSSWPPGEVPWRSKGTVWHRQAHHPTGQLEPQSLTCWLTCIHWTAPHTHSCFQE